MVTLERQYSQQDKWNPHARPHLKRVKRGVVTEGWQLGKTGISILASGIVTSSCILSGISFGT